MSDDIYYEPDRDQEPYCQVVVDFVAASEAQTFAGLVETFAREREFVGRSVFEPPPASPMRPLPQYSRPEMFLHGFCVVHPDCMYGQVDLEATRRDFPKAAFERHVDSFVALFHAAFSGRVRGGDLYWPPSA